MGLRLCLDCAHPLLYHDADKCLEVLDYDENDIAEDGTVEMCPCKRPVWGRSSGHLGKGNDA